MVRLDFKTIEILVYRLKGAAQMVEDVCIVRHDGRQQVQGNVVASQQDALKTFLLSLEGGLGQFLLSQSSKALISAAIRI